MDEKKAKALESVFQNIEKKHGTGSIIKLGENKTLQVESISTGSFTLDAALGIWGLPKGRIIEMYGPEQGGKSSLSLLTIAQAQKRGGVCAYVDAECALSPDWAKTLGVDVESLYTSQPDNGEQALDIVDELVNSHTMDVVVVDSVAALVPKAEINGEYGDAQMGLQARLMSQAMRKLTASISKSGTCVIFINQLRMKIGVYGNPITTTGGNALKFYSSVRLDVQRGELIKLGEDVIGHKIKIKVVKNKVAPPYKTALVTFYLDRGFDNEEDLIPEAVKYGIIQKSGTWYSYKEEQLAQGAANSAALLKDNTKMRDEIMNVVKAEMRLVGGVIDIPREKLEKPEPPKGRIIQEGENPEKQKKEKENGEKT